MAKIFCGIDFHKRTSTLYAISEFGEEIEQVTTVRTDRLRQYLANRRDSLHRRGTQEGQSRSRAH